MAEWQGCNILPVAVHFFNEHQLFNGHVTPPGKLGPAFAGDFESGSRLRIMFRLQDCEVRNVRPTLVAAEAATAKLIVQFTHAVGGPLYLNKYRRGSRQKGFDVSQFHREGNHSGTCLFQKFHRLLLASRQLSRRKDGEMRRHMFGSGMEFLA